MSRNMRTLCAVCLICLCLTGCAEQSVNVEVSIYELQQAMLEADPSLPEMLTVNSSSEDAETLFAYLSDFDYAKVDSYFLAYSATGLADEIAVIALKDSSDAADAAQSLEEHVQGRVNMYSFYEPDQASRAEDALVFHKENFAVLIISDHAEDVRAAFERFLA